MRYIPFKFSVLLICLFQLFVFTPLAFSAD